MSPQSLQETHTAKVNTPNTCTNTHTYLLHKYCFRLKAAEMDLIDKSKKSNAAKSGNTPVSLVFGEMDFINSPSHPLNVRQWIALTVPPSVLCVVFSVCVRVCV